MRLLFALAARNGWEFHHLDVKSAFLNGDIQEDVYVKQSQGLKRKTRNTRFINAEGAVWSTTGSTSLVCSFEEIFLKIGIYEVPS